MRKELEALKRVVSEISNYKLHGIGDENWLGIQDVLKDISTIEKSLTPPTADDVCKALSVHEKRNVMYSEKTHEFYYIEYEGKVGEYYQHITETYGDGLWSLGVYLPPHLITLIGRFYEGEI